MKEIPITDLMSTAVELVSPDTPLRDVLDRMTANQYSCSLIGEQQAPAGIVTERDLVKVFAQALKQPALLDQPVSRFMSAPPHTVSVDQSLFDALVISTAERVRHLPVVDGAQRLVGLVTQTDLTEAHFQVIARQRSVIEAAIRDRTEELTVANRELESLSMQDALLGIGNRRAMEVDIAHTHALASRHARPYCVALLDIDYFKRYNDHYGHMAGDFALQQVTQIVRRSIRRSDRLYRYGGEEFLVLLPETLESAARQLTQRIVDELFTAALPHETSPFATVTASIGIAQSRQNADTDDQDWHSVVEEADKALYQAKAAGRNRVA